MAPSPLDNIFSKVKANTKQAAQQMSLAARIAKLKVEIATQKGEKERHLKTIGVKTYAIYCKDKTLDGKVVCDEISNELNLIQRIEKHLDDLDAEIAQLQSEFKHQEGKDIVDAAEVKETVDETGAKPEEQK